MAGLRRGGRAGSIPGSPAWPGSFWRAARPGAAGSPCATVRGRRASARRRRRRVGPLEL